ncbi:MAG: Cache 3/Cache 2 fusion domain-containing protein [Oligoflexia bacterium]|nr:Cache 3/Cache 2 fusion domain-containing protein [Oligoflexia bacterium]MBF0366842.1 Cache 3/Cache 2 fusion domain-containing protein [Oligoflexia bacterium]
MSIANTTKVEVTQEQYSYVLNRKGDLLIHPTIENENLYKNDFIQEIILKGNGLFKYSWKGETVFAGFATLKAPLDWIVVSRMSSTRLHAVIIKFASFILISLTLITVFCAYFIRNFSKTLSIPIIRVSEHLDLMSQGDFSILVSPYAIGSTLSTTSSTINSSSSEIANSLQHTTQTILAAEDQGKQTTEKAKIAEGKMSEANSAIKIIEDNSKKSKFKLFYWNPV